MGIFGRRDQTGEAGPPPAAPAACASLEALRAAPLAELAAAALTVGFAGRTPQDDPHSSAALTLDLARLVAAQPAESRDADALVRDLRPLVREAIQLLERSLLVLGEQRGTTGLALTLTRRGARALADPDPASWIDAPADPA